MNFFYTPPISKLQFLSTLFFLSLLHSSTISTSSSSSFYFSSSSSSSSSSQQPNTQTQQISLTHDNNGLRPPFLPKPNSQIPNNPQNNPTKSEQQEFLDAHNEVRLNTGEDLYVWNETLAEYAAQYAHQRIHDCEMVHSNGPFGENIFWGSGKDWTPSDAVRQWVEESKFYDTATGECLPGRVCGHYTQIVWRRSSKLGCARVVCDNGDVFAICNYDPPGNYNGHGPFDADN